MGSTETSHMRQLLTGTASPDSTPPPPILCCSCLVLRLRMYHRLFQHSPLSGDFSRSPVICGYKQCHKESACVHVFLYVWGNILRRLPGGGVSGSRHQCMSSLPKTCHVVSLQKGWASLPSPSTYESARFPTASPATCVRMLCDFCLFVR